MTHPDIRPTNTKRTGGASACELALPLFYFEISMLLGGNSRNASLSHSTSFAVNPVVQVGNVVPLRKLFQIAGGGLRVHWLWAGFFRKYICAETFLRLLHAELAEQGQGVFTNIHDTGVSVFWCIPIDALCRYVA